VVAGVPPTGEDLYWDRLEAGLREAVGAFAGVAGICLIDVRGGRRLEINADVEFGTASAIKVPILLALLRRVERGEVALQERRTIRGEDRVGGSGVLQTFADPVELSVHDLARLMIRYSDNTATNACIDLAGGMAAVNGLLDAMGLHRTRLRRRMMDWEAAARGEENVSTPAQMAGLMKRLVADRAVLGEPARTTAIEILCLPKDSPFSALARPDMAVADKPGSLEGVRCDAGYFFQARRPYALAIMTSYGGEDADAWLRAAAARVAGAMAVLDLTAGGGRRLPAEWLGVGA
jgi:beta-lactamase class A